MHEPTTRDVLAMYLQHPFPQWTAEERRHRLSAELCRYRYLGLEQAMPGARFLDVGCGTGNRSMLAAKYFDVGEFVGLDGSRASLEVATKVAEEEGFYRFTPVEASLFEIPFPDASFDVVVSWGVLHHTARPWDGFAEMVRVCKPGGYLAIFLYNRWNHWRHNMQKARVSRLAGDDFEQRFQIAHKFYGKKPVATMSPQEIAEFYDQYCHPHKSDHTLGEIVSKFAQYELQYLGSFPPFRMRDALGCAQYRADLGSQFPVRGGRGRELLMQAAKSLPAQRPPEQFKTPSVLHRGAWQTVYAWLGRHGAYSGGAALSARKA